MPTNKEYEKSGIHINFIIFAFSSELKNKICTIDAQLLFRSFTSAISLSAPAQSCWCEAWKKKGKLKGFATIDQFTQIPFLKGFVPHNITYKVLFFAKKTFAVVHRQSTHLFTSISLFSKNAFQHHHRSPVIHLVQFYSHTWQPWKGCSQFKST